MRVYIGERDASTGHARVWVVNEPPRPALTEVVELIGELRSLSGILYADDNAEQARARREDVLRRKDALIRQLEAAERTPPPVELRARIDHADGYGWGGQPGSSNLAFAILRAELGEDPPPAVYRKFRADVLDPAFDRWALRVEADAVWQWVEDNRRLVEVELFEKLPAPEPEERDAPALSPMATAVNTDIDEPISEAAASEVVRACEDAWEAIRAHHPDLPDAVMVLGSGVERGRLVKLGHWWAGRWVADGQTRGEVLLAGEALHLKPEEVFEVLLHEAAHGLNAARGIKDTSREGRYHNARFGAAAREVGLQVAAMPPYGVARTSLTDDARERYRAPIDRLGEVMRIARQIERGVRVGTTRGEGQDAEPGADRDEQRPRGRALATCGCGRKLRIAPSVLAAGPIICGICEVEFTSGAERASSEANVIDEKFTSRRRAALGVAAGTEGGVEHRRVDRLVDVAGPALSTGAADLITAGAWYETVGTDAERPMRAADEVEARRRTDLARALLRADGTLRGPSVNLRGTELSAGDRVVVTEDLADLGLPAGTLGTVETVDTETVGADIDFATWGRLRAGIGETVSRFLRHDYVAVQPGFEPTIERDISRIGLEP